MFRPGRPSLLLLLDLFLLPAVLLWAAQKEGQTPSPTRNPLEGTDIFLHYCASCHGVDGRGHGPASVALKHGAPDLTRIAQKESRNIPFSTSKGNHRRKRSRAAGARQSGNASLGTDLP